MSSPTGIFASCNKVICRQPLSGLLLNKRHQSGDAALSLIQHDLIVHQIYSSHCGKPHAMAYNLINAVLMNCKVLS